MSFENTMELFGIIATSIVIITPIVVFIVKTYFTAKIEQSVKIKYDKKLEEIKFEIKKREQSALVANMFSKWIVLKDDTDKNRELNKLSFEMSLWLPDNIAIEVNKRLRNAKDSKTVMDLIIECRKLINDGKTDLKPEEITFFGL
jgi:hypothetical protein